MDRQPPQTLRKLLHQLPHQHLELPRRITRIPHQNRRLLRRQNRHQRITQTSLRHARRGFAHPRRFLQASQDAGEGGLSGGAEDAGGARQVRPGNRDQPPRRVLLEVRALLQVRGRNLPLPRAVQTVRGRHPARPLQLTLNDRHWQILHRLQVHLQVVRPLLCAQGHRD